MITLKQLKKIVKNKTILNEFIEIRNTSRCESEVIYKLLQTSWGKRLLEKEIN